MLVSFVVPAYNEEALIKFVPYCDNGGNLAHSLPGGNHRREQR